MNRNPTATLWLFAYGGISALTHCSVLSEMLEWGDNLTHNVMREDALISRSRSKVASWFLQTDRKVAGDVLLMVDHDISWEPGDLSLIARRALEHQAIVGGIYSKRTFGEGPAIRVNDTGTFQMGDDALINCDYVSTGFVAIPRAILQAVAADMPLTHDGYWPLFLPFVVTDRDGKTVYLSEDWAFCHRAQAAGFRVLASTGPKLVHEGLHGYRLVDAQTQLRADRDLPLDFGAPVEREAAGVL